MTHTYDIDKHEVRRALLQRIREVLKCLLPNGRFKKHEFYVGSIRGERGESLVVALSGSKAGLWYDHATQQGGGILALWAAVKGLDIENDFPAVLSSVRDCPGMRGFLPARVSVDRSVSAAIEAAIEAATAEPEDNATSHVTTVTPASGEPAAISEVPTTTKLSAIRASATPAITSAAPVTNGSASTNIQSGSDTSSTQAKPTAKWTYTDVDGNPTTIVHRYDSADGKKQFFPYDIKTGKQRWPEVRPLYNLPNLKDAKTVVLVEGEKAAQALIDSGICATTAMSGANALIDKTDWSPLKYKEILIWPDNDDPGKKYADAVVAKLKTEILHSVSLVTIPEDKPAKWDAADAVAEKEDINAILSYKTPAVPVLPALYDMAHAVYKTEPVPTDLVGPRILTEGGFCLIGGAPKAGKSDFLMHWLAHMATGRDFVDMRTPRPLRVVYLQAELRYHFICERIQRMMHGEHDLVPMGKKNFFFTPHMKMILDKDGVELMRRSILYHFRDDPVDVIAVDPLRYVFDGGPNNQSENDNGAMRLFLQDRIDALRDAINPNAANILVHHTRKITTEQLEDEEFQALSGAGVLHGHFSTGILLYRPDKTQAYRKAIFELRDGEAIEPRYLERVNGKWHRIEHASERLIAQEYGCKLDAEHRRKQDVIVKLIRDEAHEGSVYTGHQFCEAFGNDKTGLGSSETIRRKINILATNGHIKFFKNGECYGLPKPSGSDRGYLCVENMRLSLPATDKKPSEIRIPLPTHFKCRKSGNIMPETHPQKWTYFDEETV